MSNNQEHKTPKIVKYFLGPLIIIGLIAVILIPRSCDVEVTKPSRYDSLEIVNARLLAEVRIEKHAKDSALKIAAKKDSVRIEYKIKYYKDKSVIGNVDSLPCDTAKKYLKQIINDCDSIVKSDSLYINDLQNVLAIDNTIISKQDSIIQNDSIQKHDLKAENAILRKEVKKQKTQKKIVAGVGALGWLIAIIKSL